MSVTVENLFIGRLLQIDCSGRKSPLLGMLVDVFCVTLDANDSPTFTKLTNTAAKTDDYGLFHFRFTEPTKTNMGQSAVYATHERTDASHPAAIDEPETTISEEREDLEEFRRRYPHVLPSDELWQTAALHTDSATRRSNDRRVEIPRRYAYKVTALIETDDPARSAEGSPAITITEVMDERFEPDRYWGRSLDAEHTSVPRDSRIVFRRAFIPARNAEAAKLVGDTAERAVTLTPKRRGNAFAFLGVGRALWEEIGGFAETRPEFIGKTGYFRSADTWRMNPDGVKTQLPRRYDAPFAGTLNLFGVFGGDLSDKPLYYSVTLSRYTGDLAQPFDPNFLTDQRPVRNSYSASFYEYLSPASTDGKWKSEYLGPYSGTIDGKTVSVYRRRLPRPTNVEYWPSPSQLTTIYTWANFATVEDGLWVGTVRAFEQTGGSVTAPTLQEISLDGSPRAVMALVIDSKRVALRFDKLYPSDPTSYVKLRLVSCSWDSGGERYSPIADVTECNEVSVTPGQVGGNEGILVRFTLCDNQGRPHKHWREYRLTAEYTPRSTSDSPDKTTVNLRRTFAGTGPLDLKYEHITPLPSDPTTPVRERECVLVPVAEDGWPPEKGDPHKTPCIQYGVGLQLEAFSRQIDGWWETYYLPERTARYIVLRNGQTRCT